jgi:undecaprenyl-diphosphatase
VMLAVFGVVLYVVDRVARQDRGIDSVGPRTGLYVGTAQAIALQPGVSRSGITITAARAIGLDRPTAARFSFLMALPIILGAGVLKGAELAQTGFQGYLPQFIAGFVAAAISGFLVIWFLLRYLRGHDFFWFMVYRLAVAALVIGLIVTGVRSATI